jgi:competence protein ComEA
MIDIRLPEHDDDSGEVADAAAVLPGAEPELPPAAVPATVARLLRQLTRLRLFAGLLVISGAGLWWFGVRTPAAPPAADPFAPQLLELRAAADEQTAEPMVESTAVLPAEIVVYVSGAVVAPDVYRLAADARVIDALAAAGGVTADADLRSLNLARPLQDAEHLDVADRTAPPPAAVPAETVVDAAPAAAGRININRADVTQLQELPGIGPALAARIIAYREANGPFADMAALNEVSGIGDRIITEISERVVFTP